MRFDQKASGYHAHAAPQRRFAEALAAFAPFSPGERVTELGAGTGFLTRALLAQGAVVDASDASLLDAVCEVMAQVRRSKTEAKVSQRAAVELLVVRGPEALLAQVRLGLADLRDAGSVAAERFEPGDELTCEVTLTPPEAQ